MAATQFTLADLAQYLGAECRGNPRRVITGLATLVSAGDSDLSFLANPRYREQLAQTRAGAVIVHPDLAAAAPGDCLITSQPYLAYARVSKLFDTLPAAPRGIAPSAVVASGAIIDPTAIIAANAVIECGAVIGAESRIGANVFIGANTHIGQRCIVHPNATLYHDVRVGDECIIHSNAVIGADGFGFAPSADGWIKIYQIGGVRIGNRVEIGASSTVDRGALDDTWIGDGVIIDDQVHIAHNVRIGDDTAIAGCVGISGSSEIGSRCTLAGGVGLVGHIHIADGTHISGMTMVTKSISEKGSYSSGTPMMETAAWKKSAVRFAQLDDIARRLAALEKRERADRQNDDGADG